VNAEASEALVKIAGPVSRETFSRLQRFVALFQRWNAVTNLVAASTVEDLWDRHILDSAQLAKLRPLSGRWVDLGSGGGFPGLVLAILGREKPGFHIDLVESNRKKTAFLQTASGELGLPAAIHGRRIEQVHEKIGQVDVVTSRALASLSDLLALSEPWLTKGATALFHKGREYRREIEESSHLWHYHLIEHPSAVESQSVILEISRLDRAR
jgi:16S rRNA (guanine527-N7)-methyltransferase